MYRRSGELGAAGVAAVMVRFKRTPVRRSDEVEAMPAGGVVGVLGRGCGCGVRKGT